MESPKISIITPVLNSASTLKKAIISLINQKYKNIELIFFDGISTDSTCQIIKKYQKENPNILLICEKDDGIYDAMNKGIDASTGDWLYFMGADDELFDENVLSDLVSSGVFDHGKIVYGNVQIIGNNIWANEGDIYDGSFDLKKLLSKNICQQAIFYPRNVFEEYGKFDVIFKIIADWDFNLRCWSHEEFVFFDRMIAKFSTGGKSSIIENDKSYIKLIEKISNYFNANIFKEKNYLPESLFSELFQYYKKRKIFFNYNIEKPRDGISLFTAVKNRSDLFEKALQTWITHTEINEIVIVDWTSDLSIQSIIEKHNDNRIVLIRIENQEDWILSKAFNIAAKFTSFNKILKIDADVKIHEGFFLHHILTHSIFISGDWQIGRNENETHLCGNFFLYRSDFFKAGGFNENITMYGYDDSDLYTRLKYLGLIQHFFDYDYLYHIEHGKRMSNQKIPERFIGLADEEWARFNILKNRCLLSQLGKWTWENDTCDFILKEAGANYFRGEIENTSVSIISDEQISKAEHVAARERLIELNIFNLDFILSNYTNEQLVEIYYMHVTENDQHKQKQFEIFEKLNQLQYLSNLEKLGLENEIDLLKHLIKIKDDVTLQVGDEIIALQNGIDEKKLQLVQTHNLIKYRPLTICNLHNNINGNEQQIQTYLQQLSYLLDKLTDRINSIANENIILRKKLNNNNKIINKLTFQQEAIYKSKTYKLIQIIAQILLLFKPRLIIKKYKSWLNNRRNCKLIADSILFNMEYYLKNNADVLISGMNPAKHYLLHGGFEGRNPSMNFDSGLYLKNNPDVEKAHMNPLLHYILWGKAERRNI
jgi:glycosyltransferase involved in cell wall biosynthesis